ncbi:alanine dehydrogenase [candidate division KSB1 bacterium]
MKIGVLKEIKKHEYRVALLPVGAHVLTDNGHEVFVEKRAGEGSGFSNEDYIAGGAKILDTPEEVYAAADLILKVKEPLESEYKLITDKHVVFTYFHYAASEELTKAMVDSKSITIAYETVQTPDGSLPLLIPMSEVAGRMSIQVGAQFLEKMNGGRGILLGGVPGVAPARVVVIGGGIVGTQAALMASGMGANVTIMDVNLQRLRYLDEIMPKNVDTIASNPHTLRTYLTHADLVVGAVLIPGAKAPKLIKRDMLKIMKKGSVIVDVAVDQGGCIETAKPTTHDNPVYEIDGVVHYCVANMPGAVPYTSTVALNNATFKYTLELANKGFKNAVLSNKDLWYGVNTYNGHVTYEAVADAFNMPYKSLDEVLGS